MSLQGHYSDRLANPARQKIRKFYVKTIKVGAHELGGVVVKA